MTQIEETIKDLKLAKWDLPIHCAQFGSEARNDLQRAYFNLQCAYESPGDPAKMQSQSQ